MILILSVRMRIKLTVFVYVLCGLFLSPQCLHAKKVHHVSLSFPVSVPSDKQARQKMMDSLFNVYHLDTAAHETVAFRAGFRDNYSGDDFDYSRDKEKSTFFQRLFKKLGNLLKKLFGLDEKYHLSASRMLVLKILAVILLLVVLYFLIRLLMNHSGTWFFRKKSPELALDFDDTEQLILRADFEMLIAEAEKNANTRQSIRLFYLWLLRDLKEKELIVWTPEKTNADYVRELTDDVVRSRFEYLSYLFNCIWYGEFQVTDAEYRSARQAFLSYLGKEVKHG